MKIDFEMLEKLAAAGASAQVLLAMLKEQHARGEAKRKRDKEGKILSRAGLGKRATKSDTKRQQRTMEDDKRRQEATLDDSPRARLFREGTAALLTLGRSERVARGLIGGWLKLTHDDDQLVLATILRARDLAVADAAGWILATLKGGMNGKSPRGKSLSDAADDLIARAEDFDRSLDLEPSEYSHGSGEGGEGPSR